MPSIGKQKNTLELAQKLSHKTHFTTDECRSLLTMYQNISAMGKVDRLRLREVLHTAFDITDDCMLDRVFRVFDKDNDGVVSDVEWVEGVSTLCRGQPQELIDFCYKIYDINGDKSLAREELYHCLKGSISAYSGVLNNDEIDEAVREIVEIGMKKLDTDKDQQITEPDFTRACYHDPLLLQSIGPCLPPPRSLSAFLATFTDNFRSYSTEWNDKWKEAQQEFRDSKEDDNNVNVTTPIQSRLGLELQQKKTKDNKKKSIKYSSKPRRSDVQKRNKSIKNSSRMH